jgi:hypothetical protein
MIRDASGLPRRWCVTALLQVRERDRTISALKCEAQIATLQSDLARRAAEFELKVVDAALKCEAQIATLKSDLARKAAEFELQVVRTTTFTPGDSEIGSNNPRYCAVTRSSVCCPPSCARDASPTLTAHSPHQIGKDLAASSVLQHLPLLCCIFIIFGFVMLNLQHKIKVAAELRVQDERNARQISETGQ